MSRLVPTGWSLGHSSAAVLGSLTVARIFRRTNSDAVSLDSLLINRSVNEYRKLMLPPCAHFASYARSRSSSVASSADFTGGGYPAIPNGVSNAARRRSEYCALWLLSFFASIGALRAGRLKFAVRWKT